MWWGVWWLALVAAASSALPAGEPMTSYDLMPPDSTDYDPEGPFPALPMRPGNPEADAAWLYLLGARPQQQTPESTFTPPLYKYMITMICGLLRKTIRNENAPYGKVRVGARLMPLRPRRDFSLYPAVDLLRKMAADHSMNKQIERNRNFLDSRGKKDGNAIPDCTN